MYEGLCVEPDAGSSYRGNTSVRIRVLGGDTRVSRWDTSCWMYLRVYIPGGNADTELRHAVLQELERCMSCANSLFLCVGTGALIARDHGFVAFDPRKPLPSLPLSADVHHDDLKVGTFPVPLAYQDVDQDTVIDVPLYDNILQSTHIISRGSALFRLTPEFSSLMTAHGVELFVGSHALIDVERTLPPNAFEKTLSTATVFLTPTIMSYDLYMYHRPCDVYIPDPATGTVATLYLTVERQGLSEGDDEDVCDCSRQLLDVKADAESLSFSAVAKNTYKADVMCVPKVIRVTFTAVWCQHTYRVVAAVLCRIQCS